MGDLQLRPFQQRLVALQDLCSLTRPVRPCNRVWVKPICWICHFGFWIGFLVFEPSFWIQYAQKRTQLASLGYTIIVHLVLINDMQEFQARFPVGSFMTNFENLSQCTLKVKAAFYFLSPSPNYPNRSKTIRKPTLSYIWRNRTAWL